MHLLCFGGVEQGAAADRVIASQLRNETLPHQVVVVGAEESAVVEVSKNPATRWRVDLS